MKKLAITLALVFVLGIASTAFAAGNPFVDVPAKHWAYDAVNQLYKAGIMEGSAGKFNGDKTLTRYEIAQIVAKAMAKADKADAATKAVIDKLAVEFAAELNNLGVRVAALEKKSGLKVSGDTRFRWRDMDKASGDTTPIETRVRIVVSGDVNENTTFYGRFIGLNNDEWGKTTDTYISDANFTTKMGDFSVKVGRYSQNWGENNYIAGSVGMVDGVSITTGKDLSLTLGFSDFSQATGSYGNNDRTKAALEETYWAEAKYKINDNLKVSALYYKEATGSDSNYDVIGGGFTWGFAPDFKLGVDYTVNKKSDKVAADAKDDAKFQQARISYKGANPKVAGSYGAYFEYLKAEKGANIASLLGGASIPSTDVELYSIGYQHAIAKNILFEGFYAWDIKHANKISTAKYNGTSDGQGDKFTRLQISYFF